MQKIKTKAKAFGTFSSPTDGQIIYVDPSHDNERHHSPILTRDEAAYAFERGLIEDPDGAKEANEGEAEFVDPNALSNVIAERTAEHAKADAEVSPVPSALDSRQSTAWQDPGRVLGGAEGYADGVRQDGDSDDDAPPAPPARAATARPAPAAQAKPADGKPAGKPAAAAKPAAKPAGK